MDNIIINDSIINIVNKIENNNNNNNNNNNKLTMNKISILKKRITVELDYNCDHDTVCTICLNNMHRKVVKHIPCGHTFHLSCLNKLMNCNAACNNKCPCCRKEITISKINNSHYSDYSLFYYSARGMVEIPITISQEIFNYAQNNNLIINDLTNDIMRDALLYINRFYMNATTNNNQSELESELESGLESELESGLE